MKHNLKRKRNSDKNLSRLQGLGRIAMMRILKASMRMHRGCPAYRGFTPQGV